MACPFRVRLLLLFALVGAGLAVAACASGAPPFDEVEPNDDIANSTALPITGSAQGEAGPSDVDFWVLTVPSSGWILLSIHGVNGVTGVANLTLANQTPACARQPYSAPGRVVLNSTKGLPCPLRVDASLAGYPYLIDVQIANTSSELSVTEGEVEPDEATPNERVVGEPGPWGGWVDLEIDPVDTWSVTVPGGPQLVEMKLMNMGRTGNFTVEVVSGGITFAQTPLLYGGTWYTASYLTPPANRTLVLLIRAKDTPSNYGFIINARNMTFADPDAPSTTELESPLLQLWSFTPKVNGLVEPPDFEALSNGNGSVYGQALCVVSKLANDAFAFRVDQARYFGVLRGQGGGFVSARSQVVHAVRGAPVCFEVLSDSLKWRHDGPGSTYFLSGILYETVTNLNVTQLRAFFTDLTDSPSTGPHIQLAFWAIQDGVNEDQARGWGASNETIGAAKARLDRLKISTNLNNPPPASPPAGGQRGTNDLSSGAWGMLAVAAAVSVAAFLWVWDPPFLHRRRPPRN